MYTCNFLKQVQIWNKHIEREIVLSWNQVYMFFTITITIANSVDVSKTPAKNVGHRVARCLGRKSCCHLLPCWRATAKFLSWNRLLLLTQNNNLILKRGLRKTSWSWCGKSMARSHWCHWNWNTAPTSIGWYQTQGGSSPTAIIEHKFASTQKASVGSLSSCRRRTRGMT